MTTAENIKIYRKEKKLTQKKLGEAIGKKEITIRKYESGKLNPSIETCQQIANVLEVSLDKIIGMTPTDKAVIDSLEIIFDCIEKYFAACNETDAFNKLTVPEQQELAINLKSLLDNKIEVKNGLFDNEKNTY